MVAVPWEPFGLRSWLPLVVGERGSEVLSALETYHQGNFHNVDCHGKKQREGKPESFSHMLVLVVFNLQKAVYICILG